MDIGKSIPEQLLPHLPESLHAHVVRHYSHTYTDWTDTVQPVVAILAGMQPPMLIWYREIRGTDAVILGRIATPSRSIPLQADRIFADFPRHMGRYRHATAGGQRREKYNQDVMQQRYQILLDAWIRVAIPELVTYLSTDLWRVQCRDWAQPYRAYYATSIADIRQHQRHDSVVVEGVDTQMPSVVAHPMTCDARAIAEKECQQLAREVAKIKPQLLSIHPADVVRWASTHYPTDSQSPVRCASAVNRAGYLVSHARALREALCE